MKRTYQAHVPAVARAAAVLEHLASAPEPESLSALSRALDIGPSSLLAILNTLRARGLVSRLGRDGRYAAGPGLVSLGAAAAHRLNALHVFDALAPDLVDVLGETVLLWIQEGSDLVLSSVREGTRALRYVPPLGLRLPPPDLHAEPPSALMLDSDVLEGELDDGVWMIGVPLPLLGSSGEAAVLAVAAPSARLLGANGSAARNALRAFSGSLGSDELDGEQARALYSAGPIERAELDAFLSQGLVASLAYLSDDGYPATVPLWFDWDGGAFWLVPHAGAEWAEHVRRNPRVSLAVSESTPPLRRVLARGPVVAVDEAAGGQRRLVAARLAERYARIDAARALADRATHLLRLEPERLIAWRGLVRAVAPTPGRTRRAADRQPRARLGS